ncbi:cysteine hydrolase family protein [Clostridium chromiireducens]|uniref:cysteine hydrolase family protein n=1 Tax=Clostridium chromiireducens TaxID=225345 RepID=UPI003AF43320
MVLLVVDTQKLITNEKLYKFDTFVSNVKELIKKARESNIEVIYVRHDDGVGSELTKGTDGFEIYEEFQPINEEKIFDKNVNSSFKGTGLLEYLKDKGEKDVIIVGLQTDYCIDATIKCGFEHGFNIIVPAYANTTVDNKFMSAENSYKYHNEFMWNRRYAECISLDETIKRMK